MTNIQEIYLPIVGFEGFYEISNLGNAKSIERILIKSNGIKQTVKERVIKLGLGTNGYKFLNARKDNKSYFLYIHRIVASHFLNNNYNKPQVNHKDGIKINNNSDNLEWCTISENMKHAYDTNLQPSRSGINNPNYKHGRFTSRLT